MRVSARISAQSPRPPRAPPSRPPPAADDASLRAVRATLDATRLLRYAARYGLRWDVVHARLAAAGVAHTLDAVIERYLAVAAKLRQLRARAPGRRRRPRLLPLRPVSAPATDPQATRSAASATPPTRPPRHPRRNRRASRRAPRPPPCADMGSAVVGAIGAIPPTAPPLLRPPAALLRRRRASRPPPCADMGLRAVVGAIGARTTRLISLVLLRLVHPNSLVLFFSSLFFFLPFLFSILTLTSVVFCTFPEYLPHWLHVEK